MSNKSIDQRNAAEILDRQAAEAPLVAGQELIIDDSNKVSFPGYPYTFEALNEKVLVSLDLFKSGYECAVCRGSGKIRQKIGREDKVEVCTACKGKGGTIILIDSSKEMPTTGIIVSMGREARLKADFKVGDRVLFSKHSGDLIPTKAGVMFKRMDWYQASVKIEGADELSTFDFIISKNDQ